MEQLNSEQLRASLEEILGLCLKTVRGIRRALTDPTSRSSSGVGAEPHEGTPDEGIAEQSDTKAL